MVVVRVKGGLGNQLFQYAAGYALAKRLNSDLYLDISFFPRQSLRGFKLPMLKIEASIAESSRMSVFVQVYKNKYLNKALRKANVRVLPCGKGMKYLLETQSDIVPEYFTSQGADVYMDGYFQSETYFRSFKQELLEQIQPNYEADAASLGYRKEIEQCESVAIHVRRGDFLKAQHDSNPRHYLLGADYYSNALRYMEENTEAAQFYWFSDDIAWVKHQFGERSDFHYVSLKTPNADIDELMLMSKCKHIIAANSTFSWWAAWLNQNKDAIKIVPAKPYGNAQMIPEGWVKL